MSVMSVRIGGVSGDSCASERPSLAMEKWLVLVQVAIGGKGRNRSGASVSRSSRPEADSGEAERGKRLDWSEGFHALKGHGFSRAVSCSYFVVALATEGL